MPLLRNRVYWFAPELCTVLKERPIPQSTRVVRFRRVFRVGSINYLIGPFWPVVGEFEYHSKGLARYRREFARDNAHPFEG